MRKGMKKGAIITALIFFFISCMVPVSMGEPITTPANPTLKVLEVQPGTRYQLSSAYTNIANYNVQVTQMPMAQFVSTVDGLNGKYDIIVIGNNSYNDNVANLHYRLTSLRQGTTNYTSVPVHYSAEGDHFSKANNNTFALPQGGTSDSYENYSPNDITTRRAALLEEFVQSGQLTVFADSIFTSSDLTATILNQRFKTYRSNINNPVNHPNFHNLSSVTINDLVSKYATANKRPALTITSAPLEYNGSNAQTDKSMNLGFDASGPNPMIASLFIDLNGDGVFSATEKTIDSGDITTNNPTEGHFALNYRLPDSYTGMQPWKLELEDTVTHAKNYNTGFAAYKGTPINVRVLQLIPTSNLLNIKTGMLQPLIKVGEYTISVTVMNVANFDNNFPNPALTTTTGVSAPTQLDTNYDMVIMGFADTYGGADLKKSAAIQGLKDFIATGQSVMFTHDTLTFQTNSTSGWDYNLTKEFRDIIGQNIYNKDPLNPAIAPSDNSNRLSYPSGSSKSYGFSRLTLDRANNGNAFPNATSAAKLNDGLITKYPYVLGNTLAVATTHHQYYQLDLEDPGLVPWFTLSGTGFNSVDGRNDYYTYSKGNITYSGTGHSTPNNSEEHKLFINTILKAARGANHAPTVEIYDLKDNQEIYTNQTTLDFSFKASDLDLIKDSKLKAKLSITDNSTHVTTPVTDFQVETVQAQLDADHTFSIENNSIVKISMPKTVPATTNNFAITVTVQDTTQATGLKTITLKQVSPPSLSLSTTGNNYFLAKDAGNLTFTIAPFNNPVKDMTNIQLIIDKDQTGVCQVSVDAASNISQDNGTITINIPDYIASVSDVNHWASQSYVIHALFPQAPESGVITLNYHLKFNTKLNDVTQIIPPIDRSIDFHVRSGEIHGDVKDVKGRSIENVLITASKGTDAPLTTTTSSTGAYQFANLKSGTYTITAAGRTGYSVVVKTGSSTVSLSNSPTDNSSYQKQVDFQYSGTLVNNIGLLSLTNETTTQCIPKGIAYAKMKFTLNRPVKTMVIDLETVKNNAPTNILLKNVTFKLNNSAYTSSYQIDGNKLTLPNDLPSGSYELVISLFLGNSVVSGDTIRLNIKDLVTTEENVSGIDTVTQSANPSLFSNYSLPITIVAPPSIL